VNELKCCGQTAQIFENVDVGGKPGTGFLCNVCGNKASAVNREDAEKEFMKNAKAAPKKEPKKEPKKMDNKNALTVSRSEIMRRNESHFADVASPIIASDKGALERLIKNNIRYVENSTLLEKAWTSEEGQASIMHETEEAMIMGIELGKMGDLVPFGDVCQLIPSVEAYKFVLTNGNNSPFADLGIECVHENDQVTTGVKNKNFFFELSKGIPRGEIIGVIVWAERRDGRTIGDFYDAERLMGKAEAHSISYQRYLQDIKSFEALKADGKIKTENGREYFIKTIFKKGGGSFDKKVFRDEMSNPYDGADKPEMLRKAAGKSFLAPYMKVRNSEAAMSEARTHEESRDQAINGFDQTLSGEAEEV
jgi:hypothetical protein